MSATRKGLTIITLICLICSCRSADTSVQALGLPELEAGVFDEINAVRLRPQEYVLHLEQIQKRFSGLVYEAPDGRMVSAIEGVEAVKEAARVLKRTQPLTTLNYSPGLTLSARDHMVDIGPKGIIGHAGSDGSNPLQRINRRGKWTSNAAEIICYGADKARMNVIAWLVDDGVIDRGHRKAVLNPEFRLAGVACGPHKTLTPTCVVNFAVRFKEPE